MGSRASLDRSPRSNWVENSGELPGMVREVARAVERTGKTLSQAIAIALSRIKVWAAGGDNVKPDTQAKAAKAVAQWESLRGKNKARRMSTSNSAAVAGLRLSNPSTTTTSGDGPRITKNAATKPAAQAKPPAPARKLNPAQIKALVDRYDQVPADRRDAYRRRVIGIAKAAGAMAQIPSAWLKGQPGVPAKAGGKTSLANAALRLANRSASEVATAEAKLTAARAAAELARRDVAAAKARAVTVTMALANIGQATRKRPTETVGDLEKAVQAWGRIPAASRVKYQAYLAQRARELDAPQNLTDRISGLDPEVTTA